MKNEGLSAVFKVSCFPFVSVLHQPPGGDKAKDTKPVERIILNLLNTTCSHILNVYFCMNVLKYFLIRQLKGSINWHADFFI